MPRIFWIIPGRLAGRPGPTAEPWSLDDLVRARFDTVLNLSEHPPDERAFKAAGLKSIWVPLPTTVPADEAAEQECLEVLPRAHAFLVTELEAGHQVLVHCVAGRDRTGMLLAHHLATSHRLDPSAAISRVREVRPSAISAPGWEPMTIRVIEALASRS